MPIAPSNDLPISQPWWRKHTAGGVAVIAAGATMIALLAWGIQFFGERSIRIPADQLTLSTVQSSVFQDFIPLRGKVIPRDTVYLDALEGGRIERVLVSPGDMIAVDQPIVELSNSQLALDVLDRQAKLIESSTQLQAYQTQLEQNRLSNAKELQQIDYNITRLSRTVERYEKLAAERLISTEVLDAARDELEYTKALRPLQALSNGEQEKLRRQQLPRMESQLQKMQQDLEITRKKLDALIVRAPVAGQMTSIDLKVGENKNRGERLGEITPDTGYKLAAPVDEFYLGRILKDQHGTVRVGQRDVIVRVALVRPQVKEGNFLIDLVFDGVMPEGLLPGQTVRGKLALGDDEPALILPAGAFLERSGGNWVFVVAKGGKTATKRQIKVGRRNIEQLEILGGLKEGDVVITSDYGALDRAERVHLTH